MPNILLRSAALTNYLEVAKQLGLNPYAMLQKAGLNRAVLTTPDQHISAVAVVSLLEESAKESGCQTFGIRMAESRQLSHFGAISLLLSHQSTLRNVLNELIKYQHFLNEAIVLSIEEAGKKVIIREEVITDFAAHPRQAIELALGILIRLCSALIGSRWNPQSIHFTHEAPSDLNIHRRLFNCKLEFGSEFNGIICNAADLDFPNPGANLDMAQYARHYVQTLAENGRDSIDLEVRKSIYILLPMGRANIEQIAESLGFNVRALQRKLKERGTVYSTILKDVQCELAMRYMKNPNNSIREIAELLGFRMPTSFTRWFISQYGVSPILWRKTEMKKFLDDHQYLIQQPTHKAM